MNRSTTIAAGIATVTLAIVTGLTVQAVAEGQDPRSEARGTTWDAPARDGVTRPAGIKWRAPQPVVQEAGVKWRAPKLGTTWDAPKLGTTWDTAQLGRAWA